ncbi:hypothetical protein EMIT093MI4_110130 [Pseudomonas sp. IT-93MI4]
MATFVDGCRVLTQKRPSLDGRSCVSFKAELRLVDTFLDGVFGFADSLLGFTFFLLQFAFGLQLGVVGGFADALLDVADCFVSHAFYFIASATHGVSPWCIEGEKSVRND